MSSGRNGGWALPGALVLLVPALVNLVVHLFFVTGYGLHLDELYYLACSNHIDWGYVDHPPLSIVLLHLQRWISGDSMLSLHFLPALCGFFTVILTGLIAREMGAGLPGQLLSEICALVAPVYLAVDHYFSMNAFDVLFWLLALYLIVRLIDGGSPKLWVLFGVVVGAGFENKVSVLFLCFGLGVGLMLTAQRRILLTGWVWIGALVASVLMLPNIIWQIAHDWPTLEWIANARAHKMIAMPLPAYLFEEIMLMQPLTLLVWGTGLIALLVYPALGRYRSLGWCYIAVLALFVVQGGKPYYLAPVYPVLFAAGSIAFERWFSRRWVLIVLCAVVFAGGVMTAPLGMPLLPVESFIHYQSAMGIRPSSGERGAEGKLPSFFASMFGWENLVAVVDSVYRGLPPGDQAKCGIFCPNYAVAGAVDFYGRKYGLPAALSGHNNYWLWGTRGYTGEVMIVIGGDAESLKDYFGEVTERGRFINEYVQPMHNNLPVFVVRRPNLPLPQMWQRVKNYI
jgi:hypothetical protein